MTKAVCRACRFVMPFDGWPPGACDRCSCPFFVYLRIDMAETIWCRYPDCQTGYASVGGEKPLVCPACDMPARWSTNEPSGPPMPKRGRDPIKRWSLTMSDRHFLKALRIVAACLVLAIAASATAQTPTVQAGTFHNCGLTGTAKTAKAQALDQLKNRATTPTAAEIHPDVTAAWIMQASNDDRGRFDDKDAATIRVFVTTVKDGGAETVNCGAKKRPYLDVHIEANAEGPDYAGKPMILEVTPRWLAAMEAAGVDWSETTLKQLLEGHWVEVTGYLLLDEEHIANAVNSTKAVSKSGKKPLIWRQTCWEIHPVTAIRVVP